MKMGTCKYVPLKPNKLLLHLPNRHNVTHPLYKNLSLLVCLLSGKPLLVTTFPWGPKTLQWPLAVQARFCQSKGINRLNASAENGKDFLATLFASGLGSTINTARSVPSVFVLPNNITFRTHPLVAWFLKSIFELKPTLPRYSSIWDVSVVLEHLQTLGPLTQLDLKTLTKKTTMLLFVNGPVMSVPQEA